ncbi:MAG: 2-amino-4-hydroxy-6-hydroxymethyldihydropteridine diphosphokinase [Gammaproteobacteria bacterium]|jgi:2-amino-4-hydroxy-6-hydroxymethyldihydropteridine diphosphokinase|nr:2-amino-4-hydroxy-6-hydroxymethyldihydropteridine diphosphokinase [Gammaproteobacteria bacterium]|tara:strand:- start:236 stop:757 length:522 start_codon:yes stop_codon:yes gene_type:complete
MEVCISIGSNLASAQGTSEETVARAIEELRMLSLTYCQASSLYETSPVDCPPDAPTFINAVVKMDVSQSLNPADFLGMLQAIEQKYGRERPQQPNTARTLDLDLISFGLVRVHGAELELPHPRAHLRAFVLTPLVEVDPDFTIPGFAESAEQLLALLPSDPRLRILESYIYEK